MTKEERRLWYMFLKDLPFAIKRQKVIGEYIVDFYCPLRKIVIEIDGSQHYEDDAKVRDVQRDTYFKQQGITVLRYSNLDINCRFTDVCEDISRYIIKR
ncbi:MAG: endonuclease domain-containing protein [Clostridia bacterium]|nr:endonuclease domain-containing protein [Clostridia bacterium]